MLLDPVNAITSVNFYRRVASQGVGRSILYLAYLSLLFSMALTAAFKVRVGPEIDATFVWLEQSMPALTLQGGRVASNPPGPTTLRHPKFPDLALTVDTARAEPVTSDLLETNKVFAYITATTLYMKTPQMGRLEIIDLTKAAAPKPVVIDAAFFKSTSGILNTVLYPGVFLFGLAFAILWKTSMALLYSLLALMINAVAEGGQPYARLFNISVYAQTLVVALDAVFLFMPTGIPGFSILSLIITGVYIWLAIKRLNEPAPSAAA